MKGSIIYLITQLLFIVVILVFLIRYLWGMFFGKSYYPAAWEENANSGFIPPLLVKLEKKYPDKVRFFSFWFQIERLKKEHIPGSFAELGVYKGVTAKIIHTIDPTRKFYLFDTFEGFTNMDLRTEIGEAATYTSEHFSDTNVEKVKRYISGNQNIIFRQGYFPDSAAGLENETYALVSMDADLYNPTKKGLEYFYPRLSPGGVIIIHDYNYKWEGILKAVDEFVEQIPESLVPVADIESSVMIVKSK
ncbi:MAG: class I SAM-dependent methyltransferase [Bacteroidetes bacterium]|nr:class I SAM-dependent methyltransferase [Bacteroidota bacterium]